MQRYRSTVILLILVQVPKPHNAFCKVDTDKNGQSIQRCIKQKQINNKKKHKFSQSIFVWVAMTLAVSSAEVSWLE